MSSTTTKAELLNQIAELELLIGKMEREKAPRNHITNAIIKLARLRNKL